MSLFKRQLPTARAEDGPPPCDVPTASIFAWFQCPHPACGQPVVIEGLHRSRVLTCTTCKRKFEEDYSIPPVSRPRDRRGPDKIFPDPGPWRPFG